LDEGLSFVSEIRCLRLWPQLQTIMDGLAVQFAGGPFPNPNFTRQYFTILASRDPVAIDSLVLPRVEKLRQMMSVPPIGNTASYIKSGAYYQLGTTDRRRIQLVHLQ